MKKLLKSVISETLEQCTSALFTVDLSTIAGWGKKKKKKEKMRETWNATMDVESKHMHSVRNIWIESPSFRLEKYLLHTRKGKLKCDGFQNCDFKSQFYLFLMRV